MSMANEIIHVLSPIREKFEQLSREPAYLEAVLEAGALKAKAQAEVTWDVVLKKIGAGLGKLKGAEFASRRVTLEKIC